MTYPWPQVLGLAPPRWGSLLLVTKPVPPGEMRLNQL